MAYQLLLVKQIGGQVLRVVRRHIASQNHRRWLVEVAAGGLQERVKC